MKINSQTQKTASDLRGKDVELGGLEPPTPCLQTGPAPPADQAEW